MLDNVCHSTINFSTAVGMKVKELTDAITPHAQELFDTHLDLEKVVIPLGGTLMGTAMAWFVMSIVLRQLHKHALQSPLMTLLGDSYKKDMSYQTNLWSALEDPAKYIITFMAFSQMAAVIAPSISAYLPQAWRGAFVVSFVWFLHRWKANFIANAMANQTAIGITRERLSAFDKAGSIEGQVVEIRLTSTSLINLEKLPIVVPNSLFSSQMIVNKSRALWRARVAKIPVRIKDLEKIPAISEEIKVMLRSNPQIDAPYCSLKIRKFTWRAYHWLQHQKHKKGRVDSCRTRYSFESCQYCQAT